MLATHLDLRHNISMNPKTPSHGGSRSGAGRKPGTGLYGEPTQTLRLPVSAVPVVKDFLQAYRSRPVSSRELEVLALASPPVALMLPLFGHKVPAGFPSPADDHVQATLDLNEHLVHHRESTYFVRVQGHSMTGAGIFDGDLLVVDRALEPVAGKIIIAVVDGELTVKRLDYEGKRPILRAQNPHFKDIPLNDGQELQCWGVVTSAIRTFD